MTLSERLSARRPAPGTAVLTPNGRAVVIPPPSFMVRRVLVRHANGATWSYEPEELSPADPLPLDGRMPARENR